MSPTPTAVSNSPVTYSLTQSSQLPPQPYIPPPGSASIHYSAFQNKPTLVQYPKFSSATPQLATQPNCSSAMPPPATAEPVQQFLVPQAPPGSNPYPPQFTPPPPTPTTMSASVSRFSSASSSGARSPASFVAPSLLQKPFSSHPAGHPNS